VKRTLAEAAFDQGATSISTVTGTQAGTTLSATQIDQALTCFALTPAVEVSEAGVATITVNYDFGISKFSLSKGENDVPSVTVKAMVQSGEDSAQLADGATMVLQMRKISATENDWTDVTDATFTKDSDDVYTTTVSVEDVSNVKFRVLATKETTAAE